MAYNDFSLDAVMQQFGLDVRQEEDLFGSIVSVSISDLLRQTLAGNVPLAVDIGTEKARSEFIIAPILAEVRRQAHPQVSLFSGVEFNVDIERGLRGVCDFLFSLSPLQLAVQAPVVAIVEAKNDSIKSGIGQCVAEMLAAQIFNGQRGNPIPTVYGVITTGSVWKFLHLRGSLVAADEREYYIKEVERIVAVLVAMVNGTSVIAP
jgi:hypothetical protein